MGGGRRWVPAWPASLNSGVVGGGLWVRTGAGVRFGGGGRRERPCARAWVGVRAKKEQKF